MSTQTNNESGGGPLWERAFAVNMKRLREGQDISQNELAKRLKERGLPFHQVTVQRIEDLERSVRLDEAYLIARELGSTVDSMVLAASDFIKETNLIVFELKREASEILRMTSHKIPAISEMNNALMSFLGNIERLQEHNISLETVQTIQRMQELLFKLGKQLTMAEQTAREISKSPQIKQDPYSQPTTDTPS